jgi:hypothetical protein
MDGDAEDLTAEDPEGEEEAGSPDEEMEMGMDTAAATPPEDAATPMDSDAEELGGDEATGEAAASPPEEAPGEPPTEYPADATTPMEIDADAAAVDTPGMDTDDELASLFGTPGP